MLTHSQFITDLDRALLWGAVPVLPLRRPKPDFRTLAGGRRG